MAIDIRVLREVGSILSAFDYEDRVRIQLVLVEEWDRIGVATPSYYIAMASNVACGLTGSYARESDAIKSVRLAWGGPEWDLQEV